MKKINPMLITAAEEVTQKELYHAPQLPTLIALDAALLATIDIIWIYYQEKGYPEYESIEPERNHENEIAYSIARLAINLRKKLSSYYVEVKENFSKPLEQKEVVF